MTRDEEAFDRLVGADPADGVETRTGVLRAKTDELADGGAEVEHAAGPDTSGPGTDELAARRGLRRPGWMLAAAVAGAVVLGGGGFAVGTVTAGQAPGSDVVAENEAAPPITLGGARDGDAEAAMDAEAGQPGVMADEAMSSDLSVDSSLPGWSSGRVVFESSGLSSQPGTATAYAYDATAHGTAERLAEIAAALGIAGEPEWSWSGWNVGDDDGTSVSVEADGTAYFGYHSTAKDPWRCEEDAWVEIERLEAEGGASESDYDKAVDEACADVGSAPSAQDAADQVRDLMRQIGVDPGRYEFEVPQADEDRSRWVQAHEVVDGQRTGATWSATVGPDGVAWLDGFLADVVPLTEYPVISAVEAVERLGDPRFTSSMWPVVTAREEYWDEPYDEDRPPSPPPAPPTSGDPVLWPVGQVTITSARLGLTQHWQADGATMLVPAYELSDAEGNVWSVVAVAESALDMSAP